MTFVLDGVDFGTVDFTLIWSVVAPMVQTLGPVIAVVIGLQVAALVAQSIAGAMASRREQAEDAVHAANDAYFAAIDGVSFESGVMGKFSAWSAPDSALGGRSGDLDDFLADYDLGAASIGAFGRLSDSDVPSLVTDSGAESDSQVF